MYCVCAYSRVTEDGVNLMEAMLLAVDCINNNTALLPNIMLGYDIHDTCSSENVGLDQSVAWATASIIEEQLWHCDAI